MRRLFAWVATLPLLAAATPPVLAMTLDSLDAAAREAREEVIAWRRDFHANPELSNREFRTSGIVAGALRAMGYEVRTGIAFTGVVGILRGAQPGPVVAVRADMDALPVTERVDLPFASQVTTEYAGQTTGVMHACGHDAHTAILLGVARVFAAHREQLAGTLMLIFQPAEESPPPGEEGGAELMLKEGLFDNILKPDVIFGLHVWSGQNVGQLAYRSGPMMASGDRFSIVVRGVQTHGSRPWGGIDPISVAAQIVQGLDSIAARQIDVTKAPAVISIGSIQGGIRFNIIPDSVSLSGTVRSFDEEMRQDIARRIERTATSIAQASGATAEVDYDFLYPVTINEPALTARSVPVLQRVAGADNVIETPLITGAEDFSFFQREVPGFYFFVGATPPGQDPLTAPTNHSPLFYLDEQSLDVGLRAMVQLVSMALGGE
jgi:amidohydrolase